MSGVFFKIERFKNDKNKYNQEYSSIIRSVPEKERQLLNITRQQEIKNSLYTYLLERREEAAISQAGTLSDVSVVQAAVTGDIVSPLTGKILLTFISLAVLLVIAVLFVKSSMNNKILGKEDVESRTLSPILGEIIQVERQ